MHAAKPVNPHEPGVSDKLWRRRPLPAAERQPSRTQFPKRPKSGNAAFRLSAVSVALYYEARRRPEAPPGVSKSVLRCFQWNRSSHSWSSDGSAPALTLCPFPAFGRPVRTELGTPNSRSCGALFLPPGIRPPREPTWIPPVVPRSMIRGTMGGLRRVSGESPMALPGSDSRSGLYN